MVKHDDSRLKCSFCGKTQDQVKKLIAGPEFISAMNAWNCVMKY